MIYVKSLTLENVKCFGKRQTLDFTDGKGKISQWTVILGDNGVGKTTVLQGVVGMLPPPKGEMDEDSSPEAFWRAFRVFGNDQKSWLRQGSQHGRIQLSTSLTPDNWLVGNAFNIGISFSEGSSQSPSNKEHQHNVTCIAYGANRKMGSNKLAEKILSPSSVTLFSEDAFLPNSSEYFLRLDYETAKSRKGSRDLDRVKELLLKVLPSGIKDLKVEKVERLQREVMALTPYGWVSLGKLSLGYKTSIAWLIDFASRMIHFHPNSKDPFAEPAILVVDEIDLHMHPKWQQEIIDNLTKVFPRTQFIVTAHSPLIAQAALESNIVLLKRVGDHVVVENDPEVVKGWRIDQVLTSDLYGLKGTRPKSFEKKIARRRTLLKKNGSLTAKEKAELTLLNEEVGNLPIGETPEENDAMRLIRELAKKI